LWTTTIGNGLIKQMMGYRQSMPKIGLNLCPEFVDHYKRQIELQAPHSNSLLGLEPAFASKS
ncbi:hypothetical protein KW437_22580, partial [Vibrio fluvialis]|nr:hypothetical protein [Vibrio fluvialis]